MNNGNISKKAIESQINKNSSKSKVNLANIISKPNSGINSNNNIRKKEEEDTLIFKDKSPIMFNRSKNNFYLKDSGKMNTGKFNTASANTNLNTNNLTNNKVEIINNPIGKINGNNIVLNKNVIVKSLLSSNSNNINSISNSINSNYFNKQKSPNNNGNSNKNEHENLFKKNLSNNEKTSSLMVDNIPEQVNQLNQVNEALKRELDLLKTEISIANLVLNKLTFNLFLLINPLVDFIPSLIKNKK